MKTIIKIFSLCILMTSISVFGCKCEDLDIKQSFKDEVLKGLQTQKFKGKDMRAEVAN